jgi:hypothetical protein
VSLKKEKITTPLNDPVSKIAAKQAGRALQGNNDPVMNMAKLAAKTANNANSLTTPLNDPVMSEGKTAAKQVESSFRGSGITQAGLGRLICEQCGIDTQRKTFNQRFCCTDCRVKNWEQSTGGKVLKNKVT